MLRDVVRKDGPEYVLMEALAAETLAGTSVGDVAPLRCVRRRKPRRRDLARYERRRRLFEVPAPIAAPTSVGVEDAWEHLAVLQQIQALRHGLSYERLRVLLAFQGRALHRQFGWTAHQHVEHVLGLAPKDVARGTELLARLSSLPAIASAWREGVIGERDAWKLSTVALRTTDRRWLEHWKVCAPKRLAAEIDWHVAIRTVLPKAQYLATTGGLPAPGPQSDVAFAFDWRSLFGVREREARAPAASRVVPEVRASDDSPSDSALDPDAPWLLPAVSMLVRVGFSAPSDVASLIRCAIGHVRGTLPEGATEGTAVVAMLSSFAATHGRARPGADAGSTSTSISEAVLERDGWRCANPICRSRGPLHVHHIRFRSQGGTDDPSNLVTLCDRCHRRLHSGHLRIEGEAPEQLVFHVGRRWGSQDGRAGVLAREAWHGGRRMSA